MCGHFSSFLETSSNRCHNVPSLFCIISQNPNHFNPGPFRETRTLLVNCHPPLTSDLFPFLFVSSSKYMRIFSSHYLIVSPDRIRAFPPERPAVGPDPAQQPHVHHHVLLLALRRGPAAGRLHLLRGPEVSTSRFTDNSHSSNQKVLHVNYRTEETHEEHSGSSKVHVLLLLIHFSLSSIFTSCLLPSHWKCGKVMFWSPCICMRVCVLFA